MSDIFDLFEIEPPEKPERTGDVPVPMGAAPDSDSLAGVARVIRDLAELVREIPGRAREFSVEPDLFMVAVAVEDLLAAAGHHGAATAAAQWATYEASGRRSSKIEEARARAEALYRDDLEAIGEGREPLHKTDESSLPWRKPD